MSQLETTHPTMPAAPNLRTKLGRFGPLFIIFQLGWSTANNAASPLLQASAEQIAPGDKIGFYATMSTCGAALAVVAIIVAGALSDRTRSRFGRRVPWILGGGLTASVALAITGLTTNAVAVIVAFAVYQMAVNAMLAAALALTPDYLAHSIYGRASSASGIGVLLGGVVGGIVAAVFITTPTVGLVTIPWLILIVSIVVSIFLPRASNRSEPQPRTGAIAFVKSLKPVADAQFWWVFVGRFLFILALFMTVQYQFFIASDYLKLSAQEAGNLLALCSLVLAVCAGIATVGAGPLSDRIGRKPFVIGAPLLTIVGVLPLIFFPDPWALVMFFVLGGLAYGAYLSVDAALMVDVLPNKHTPAKDLAVLNASNTLPLVFAPAISGILVGTIGYQAAFIATIVACLAGAACILRVKRVK